MEVTNYKISRGATVNLGNYESARVDLELTAIGDASRPLSPSLAEVLAAVDGQLKAWLQAKVHEIQEAAGLPPHPVDRFTGGEE